MHLGHEVEANSTFGQILQLYYVCWLDITGYFYVSPLCFVQMMDTAAILQSFVHAGRSCWTISSCLENDEG